MSSNEPIDEKCGHVDLTAESVAVSQIPPAGATRVECPCCHLPGSFTPPDSIDGMVCPYCDVQAVGLPTYHERTHQ